jgi:hypothetical protein
VSGTPGKSSPKGQKVAAATGGMWTSSERIERRFSNPSVTPRGVFELLTGVANPELRSGLYSVVPSAL